LVSNENVEPRTHQKLIRGQLWVRNAFDVEHGRNPFWIYTIFEALCDILKDSVFQAGKKSAVDDSQALDRLVVRVHGAGESQVSD
jgi:hypothetical protein